MRTAPARDVSAAVQARADIRAGRHTGPTSGLAPGFAQANLVVLPHSYALDFLRFCVRNPKPCPLLDVTETGSPCPEALAPDADLRSDVPRYRVFADGECIDEPTDVHRYWRADLVAFLLGCSFTFEWALAAAGIPLAHQRRAHQRADVRDRPALCAGRTVPRSDGGLDASDAARRSGPRRAGDVALPGDARRPYSGRSDRPGHR